MSAEEAQQSAEQGLLSELAARGALLDAVPGVRPDGVRGLFADRDLEPEEMACWVPNEVVLEESTCDPELRESIAAVLQDTPGLGDMERHVYSRTVSLALGYLLEKARGPSSFFHSYILSLPGYPPTANTFTMEEREAFAVLGAPDLLEAYAPLVDAAAAAAARAAALWEAAPAPGREEVEGAFFFVLSRMSHTRMIPLVDLANAALPGEDNARILVEGQVRGGREGCAVVMKRAIKKGDEVVISYNHEEALSMLLAYGCTLGMEHTRSMVQLHWETPQCLKSLLPEGSCACRLLEQEPAGLPEHVITQLRMGAFPSREELVLAVESGFFQDNSAGPGDKVAGWRDKQREVHMGVARFCATSFARLDQARAAIDSLSADSLGGAVAKAQYATDRRLLLRCATVMSERAAALEIA